MVAAQCGITVTGVVVRVTGSGLGCPTWPNCQSGSLVPTAHPELGQFHQWVEFGNRMLTGVIGVLAVLVLLDALLARPRRKRQLWLAASMPLGIVAQAVIGGITVLTKLAWYTVCLHFIVSPILVWFAVLLYTSLKEGDEPARPRIPQALRALLVATTVTLWTVMVAGTLVTAAGPHAGDANTPRLGLPVATLAQVHADAMFLLTGMLIALGFALRISGGTPTIWRRYWILIGLVLAQGVLGMVQYWTGVPEVLVIFHVLGAVLIVATLAFLWTDSRDRGPFPTRSPAATSELAAA
jgi:cytochrome c oxidase assembly protein subunit 15